MKHLLILLMAAGIASAQTETRGASSQTGTYTNTAGIDASAATVFYPPKGTSDPATCGQGQVFYRTDTNKLRKCTATNTWADAEGSGSSATAGYGIDVASSTVDWNPADPRYVVITDEFLAPVGTGGSYSLGSLAWRIGTKGTCTPSYDTASFTNPGQIYVTSAAASGNGCWVNFTDASGQGARFGSPYTDANKFWEMVWVVKMSVTTNIKFYIGMSGAYSGDQPGANGFFFRYDSSADTYFTAVSMSSSTSSTSATTVSPDANFHTFRLYSDGATASKMYMSIDGGTAKTVCASGCDITTNISTSMMSPLAAVFTSTTSAVSMYLDFFAYRAKVSTNAGRRN